MKSRKFVLVADTHGDMIDTFAESAFFDFVKEFNPEVRIHAGDMFDFRNLRMGASDDEKACSLQDDWDMGKDFFHRFFTGGKDNHYLLGNHSHRLWRVSDSCKGLLRDYANDGIKKIDAMCSQRRVHRLPYDARLGVLDIGKLRVIHGYHSGINAATCHARVYGNCYYGHVHTQDVSPVPNIDGPAEARGIGCLCKIDMPYNQTQTNKLRHQQGWVYGELFDDGTYQAFQTKRINNSFYVAQNIKRYGK